MIVRALNLGDALLAELVVDDDIQRCDVPGSRQRRRPDYWRAAPVIRRRFHDARQLRPSVWVADDLAAIVLPAAEAMTTHDPVEMPGPDGAMRRWRRCTSDVWARLRAERPRSPALDALRDLIAQVHGFNIPTIARVNGQAAA